MPSIQLVSSRRTISSCLVSYLPDGRSVVVFVYNLKSSLEKTVMDNKSAQSKDTSNSVHPRHRTKKRKEEENHRKLKR